jgi:hypothetical protein
LLVGEDEYFCDLLQIFADKLRLGEEWVDYQDITKRQSFLSV